MSNRNLKKITRGMLSVETMAPALAKAQQLYETRLNAGRKLGKVLKDLLARNLLVPTQVRKQFKDLEEFNSLVAAATVPSLEPSLEPYLEISEDVPELQTPLSTLDGVTL